MSYDAFLTSWSSASEALDTQSAQTGLEYSMEDVGVRFLSSNIDHVDTDLATELGDAFVREWSRPVTLIEGVPALLQSLRSTYKVGLITNTHSPDTVYRLLREFSLDRSFDTVVTSLEFGRPKPDAAIFHATLKNLGVAPEASIYVGDNFHADYLGARGAGIDSYLIGRHARIPREHGIDSVLDLPMVLRRLI